MNKPLKIASVLLVFTILEFLYGMFAGGTPFLIQPLSLLAAAAAPWALLAAPIFGVVGLYRQWREPGVSAGSKVVGWGVTVIATLLAVFFALLFAAWFL